jgi:hypothetical protein
MELSTSLACQCNNKTYSSKASLKSHKETNVHMVWELSRDVHNLEIRCKKQENDIAYEKRINILLSERLSNLEKSLETEDTFLHERLHGIRKHPVHSRFKETTVPGPG